ncbi:MAG: hypothetical protein MZU97_09005 [Bacillus subtilis]|nr:hypothetical protein [Bacillus subtilis]
MNAKINELKNKIIVSCQASLGEPLFEDSCLMAMVKSVINGGASGLRLANPNFIKQVRQVTDLPIIGITKPEHLPDNWKDIVYITPTLDDARQLAHAGCDIIALDGTARHRDKENLEEILEKINTELKCLSRLIFPLLKKG